jgi:hypothetical protein
MYRARRFIAVFSRTHHWTPYWASWIPFTFYLFKTSFNIIVPSTSILLVLTCSINVKSHTYLLTYFLVQDILWKTVSRSACQRVACFLYGIRSFIIVLTKARHWTLSWASRIQFTPSIPTSLRSIFYPAEAPNVPSSKYHVLFQLLRSYLRISSGPRCFETFRNKLHFYGEGFLAPRPTPNLEDRFLSAVRDCFASSSINSFLPFSYPVLILNDICLYMSKVTASASLPVIHSNL